MAPAPADQAADATPPDATLPGTMSRRTLPVRCPERPRTLALPPEMGYEREQTPIPHAPARRTPAA